MRGALLIFLLLISCVVAKESYPWQNLYWSYSNQYIFHFANIEVWDVWSMHNTLDSLELDLISYDQVNDLKIHTKIQEAKFNYEKANYAKNQCSNLYSEVVKQPRTELSYTVAKLLAAEFSKKSISECYNYPKYWKSTMENSAEALDFSISNLESQFSKTESALEDLEYAGICTDVCNLDEDKYNLLRSYHSFFQEQIHNPNPDLAGYRETIVLANSKTLVDLQNKESELRSFLKSSIDDYKNQIQELKLNEDSLSSKIQALEKENIHLIGSTTYLGPVVVESDDTYISDQFSNLKVIHNAAEENLRASQFIYSSKSKFYMKEAAALLSESTEGYLVALSIAEDLEAEANTATSNQKTEALAEIDSFEKIASGRFLSAKTQSLYQASKDYFESGEDEKTLGLKYQNYEKSATYARMAKDSLSAGSNDVLLSSKLSFFSDLLKKSKTDGIEISYEEAEFNIIKHYDEPWILENIENLIASIKQKAQIKYKDLEDQHLDILSKIYLAPDLLPELSATEVYYKNNKLDFLAALGNLKNMEELYSYIESELIKESNKFVLNNLQISLDEYHEPVELDKVVNLTATLYLINPTKYNATNLEFVVPTADKNYQLLSNENIKKFDPKTMKVTLGFIHPNELIKLDLHKESILAKTVSKESESIGNPDGTATITEKIKFTAERDLDLAFDNPYIDGDPKNSVLKGEHILEKKILVLDAYSISFKNHQVKKVGTNYEVNYELEIVSEIDLDRLNFLIKEEGESFLALSYSGEKIEEKKSLSNGLYSISVSKLTKQKQTILKIFYTIKNTTDYFDTNQQVNQNNTKEILSSLVESNNKVQLNNFLTNKEKIELETLKLAVEKEKQKIGSAISGQVDTPVYETLEARLETLNSTMNSLGNLDSYSALEDLRKVDNDWLPKYLNDYKKESFAEYKQLKEKLLELEQNKTDFSNFLNSYNQFRGSGNIEDAVKVSSELKSLKSKLNEAESSEAQNRTNYSTQFELFSKFINDNIEVYAKNYESAKNSQFGYIFKSTPSEIKKDVERLQKLLNGKQNAAQLLDPLNNLNNKKTEVENTIGFLKNESSRKLSNIKSIFASKTNTLDQSTRSKIADGIKKTEEYINNESYVDSLKASAAVLKLLDKPQSSSDNQDLLLLALASLLIMGLTAAYILKRKSEPTKNRTMRKLKRI